MSAQVDATSREMDQNAKHLANLRARFALLGQELHLVVKSGQVYYEVRPWGQCRTYSTLHDLEGFLAVIGGLS
jgi:hypothetical protein